MRVCASARARALAKGRGGGGCTCTAGIFTPSASQDETHCHRLRTLKNRHERQGEMLAMRPRTSRRYRLLFGFHRLARRWAPQSTTSSGIRESQRMRQELASHQYSPRHSHQEGLQHRPHSLLQSKHRRRLQRRPMAHENHWHSRQRARLRHHQRLHRMCRDSVTPALSRLLPQPLSCSH